MGSAYAFMFDAEHESLDFSFGPPCTKQVVQAMEAMNDRLLVTQIHKGSVLPHMEAYRISSVFSSGDTSLPTLSIQKTPDYELYGLVVCELADSICEQSNTLDADEFLIALAKKDIWTIVLPTITAKQAAFIDAKLKSFAPYYGMTNIDQGNPLHMRQFSLIEGMFFCDGKLHYEVESWAAQEDRDEVDAIARMYADNPIAVPSDSYQQRAPVGLIKQPLSVRGRLSEERISGRSQPTHRQRIAAELATQFHNGAIPDFEFRVDNVTGREFMCEESKVRDYLLNIDHPQGGSKARFFVETLRIEKSDWQYLADQIERAMDDATLFRVGKTQFGITHRAFIKIRGRNGREVVLQTGWELRDQGAARLVTAYPGHGGTEIGEAPQSAVIDPTLKGDQRWNEIYQTAHRVGLEAARRSVPTPMVLQGYAPIFGGMCGFAWVKLPDARSQFCRWLVRQSIGHRDYRRGYRISPALSQDDLPYADMQSIEPKIAYCAAFAEVLRINGLECTTNSRLD